MTHGLVPEGVARGARGGLAPVARSLAAAGVGANAVTAVGSALVLAGAAALAVGAVVPALALAVAGSLADALDGAVARARGGGTRLGSFLDSTLDRLSDAALLVATAWVAFESRHPLLFWAAALALVSSSGVSYVRAKAESLGVAATVGPAPREARLVIFLAGLAAWAALGEVSVFVVAVVAVAALATITFIQRVATVAARLSGEGDP